MSEQSLIGKTALVTGATGGIGQSICEHLVAAGASVAACGRNTEKLQALENELSSNAAEGAQIRSYELSLGESKAADETVQTILKDFDKLDVLVNNAGATADGLLIRMSDEAFEETLKVNLTGAFQLLRSVAKPMMKARTGSIINIASVVAITGNPGQANYCSAKAGLIGLTKSAARELASRGVRVNAIAPGFIETAMTDKLNEEQKKHILTEIPLGRIGKPEEVSAMVNFLASDDSSYVTGQVFNVCGGLVMQ